MGGTWYLVPTPFTPAGDLDLESLGTLVEAAISWGVDGLTVMGVMSEPAMLTADERTESEPGTWSVRGWGPPGTTRVRVPISMGTYLRTPAGAALKSPRLHPAAQIVDRATLWVDANRTVQLRPGLDRLAVQSEARRLWDA